MKKILLIDNYDSFTYNLYHQIEKLTNSSIDVVRNDEIEVNTVDSYDVIVFSPGPKLPKDAGKMIDIIHLFYRAKPMIGICLGMQGIAECLGSELEQLSFPEHGQSKKMIVTEKGGIFKNCPDEFFVGRYHSWGIKRNKLSKELKVLSVDENDWVMSFQHRQYRIYGLQYHPESILTEYGDVVMKNLLHICLK